MNPQAHPSSSPELKLIPWLLALIPKLQADTRLNGHGVLLDHECKILCSVLVRHVATTLQSFSYGYGISERYLTSEQTARFADRGDRLRKVDEAKLIRDRSHQGREMHELAKLIASSLTAEATRLLGTSKGQDFSVFDREPSAAAYYVSRLLTAWHLLSPAQKFLLIGGEQSLLALHGGRIPPSALRYAIFHLCSRGTSTSGATDIFQNVAEPVVSPDQIDTARGFLAKIPSMLDLLLVQPRVKSIPVLVLGLQRVISKRGRSIGSRKGGFKRTGETA